MVEPQPGTLTLVWNPSLEPYLAVLQTLPALEHNLVREPPDKEAAVGADAHEAGAIGGDGEPRHNLGMAVGVAKERPRLEVVQANAVV